jgi:hypothetical protein
MYCVATTIILGISLINYFEKQLYKPNGKVNKTVFKRIWLSTVIITLASLYILIKFGIIPS